MDSELHARTEGLNWRRIDDEIVILDTEADAYFSLNGSAALLWERLAGEEGARAADLVAALVDEFDLAADQAEQDVAAFLASCAELNLVA